MSAVTADIGECPRNPVFIAYQQDSVGTGTDRPLRPDAVEFGRVADAVPPGEDVALLPLEYRRVDIGLPRKHPG